MAEPVEQLHLLLAVPAHRVVFRQIFDQLANPCPELVGEVRRRRTDERVDVVLRGLRHRAASLSSRLAHSYLGGTRPDSSEVVVAGRFGRVRRFTTADLMLTATVLIWALNFTVTKYVLEHGFQPLAYSTVRYGAAALLFAGLTYGIEGSLRVGRRHLLLLLAAAAVGIWLNQLSYVYAIKLTTASTTALILGATPIFTALFAFAVGLERLRGRFWVAAVVSFVGVALIAAGASGGLTADLKGDALGVATAATWAAYSVAVAPLMRTYSPVRISAFVLLAGWIPLAASAAGQIASQSFSLEPLVWLCLGYAILGPLVLTNVLWFSAVHRVGPSHATLFANMQPFIAVIFAVLILSERLTLTQFAGGIAVGVAVLLSRPRERPVLARPE
jgi:drug/metabolite transporter (DMT)-like permease